MQTSQNTFKPSLRLLASLMLFTRLPWWRIKNNIPARYFERAVDFWPWCGWVTGGIMALTYMVASSVWDNTLIAATLAVIARLLTTGALHEDGLADFIDGMGAGGNRERTLSIMKDSHTGTYGVLGLIAHSLLLVLFLGHLPSPIAPLCILTADVWGKSCASLLIAQLPYARTAAQAKTGVVYHAWGGKELCFHLVRLACALLPIVLWWCTIYQDDTGYRTLLLPLVFLSPLITEWLLMRMMKHRLGGYTGDCCGATFLLCELTIYTLLNIAH